MSDSTCVGDACRWARQTPDRVWLTQPMGGAEMRTLTWRQALDEARRMAAHLESRGLPARSHIAIFSKNCAWWILADLAIWMAGHVSVPLYPNLTARTIRQILDSSDSRLVFVGKLDDFEKMQPGIPPELPRIRLPLAPASPGACWDELIAQHAPQARPVTRSPEELATLIHTSGTTGAPKGVMLSFGAMRAATEGIVKLLGLQAHDRMLSYLPLAHAFERGVVEQVGLAVGFPIFFSESLDTFLRDLKCARPTLFVSVPRLWQKFQQGVLAKMPETRLRLLLTIPIVKQAVRRRVLASLGLDAVRLAASGSAPLPATLLHWYLRLGLELIEGYGMSETFNYGHVTRVGQVRDGSVGPAMEGVECRVSPEGEVLLKSPGMMMGYYRLPEETAAVFTPEGFFKTGDRGELDARGHLRLAGRIGELFKTSKGKYVAPAPIEGNLLAHPEVEQAYVGGLGCPQPFGLVSLSDDGRRAVAAGAGRRALHASLGRHLARVNDTLDRHEQMAFLAVITDVWDVDSGFLTPTLKIRRRALDAFYGPRVPAWYDAGESVIWPDGAAA